MSASPIARQACSHAQIIPSKRVLITDANELPDVYASTPGGTLYSTTPGGKHFKRYIFLPVLLFLLPLLHATILIHVPSIHNIYV